MKTSNFIMPVLLLFTGIIFISCNPQRQIAGNYNYETECLGVEMDGSQTIKAWGNGRNRTDAIEQAKKNAVRDILFKGVRGGKPECELRPVVSEVNAQQKYEDYFSKFFADGGTYKDFISKKDGSDLHLEVVQERKKSGSQETYGVTIRVLRSELKAKMTEDKIINQ